MTVWWGWVARLHDVQTIDGFTKMRLSSCAGRRTVMKINTYIGFDVFKDTIDVAVAEFGRTGDVHYYGEIGNTPDAVEKLLKKPGGRYGKLHFVYEARPCGYGLYHQINYAGQACDVVSPRSHAKTRGRPRQDGSTRCRDARPLIARGRTHDRVGTRRSV